MKGNKDFSLNKFESLPDDEILYKIEESAKTFDNLSKDIKEINNRDRIDYIITILKIISKVLYHRESLIKKKPKKYARFFKGIAEILAGIQREIFQNGGKQREKLVKRIFNSNNNSIHKFIKFLFIDKNRNGEINDLLNDTTLFKYFFIGINDYAVNRNQINSYKAVGNQYSDTFQFFFELLQNAVDANSKKVLFKSFQINGRNFLVFANNGNKFIPMDVLGICSIGQGFKSSKTIGYFGIGYKSVASISNQSYILSSPLMFKLNIPPNVDEGLVVYGAKVEKFINEIKIKIKDINNITRNFTNIFILTDIQANQLEEFINYCQKIDYRFLIFLEPLQTIQFSLNNLKKEFKAIKSSLENIEIIKINNEMFFIEKLNPPNSSLKELDLNFGRQAVIIAIRLKKKQKRVSIVSIGKTTRLYAYFPVNNVIPGFNFLLHGHFFLTSTRESLEPLSSNIKFKVINEKLLKEAAPYCLLHAIKKLSSQNVLGLKDLIPFKEIPFKDQSSDNSKDNLYVYETVRKGLISLLRKPKHLSEPFWWDSESESYLPLSNILFFQDDIKNTLELFTYFTHKFPKRFNEFISRELNVEISNGFLYFSKENDYKDFCGQILNDIDRRIIKKGQVAELIDKFLTIQDNFSNEPYFEIDAAGKCFQKITYIIS
ncbi:MAG: sacsin N-terminal ATP-binding-like domain-containing protein, partial [Promethearchaeota archaeon]